MTPNLKILSELLTKFPEAHSKTIARIAYREYPQIFSSLESARTSVRYLRGNHGTRDRNKITVKGFLRENKQSGDPFAALPKSREHLNKWGVVEFPDPAKALVISDVHVPYHDGGVLQIALRYGRDRGADFVLLNGDIADCFSVSAWEKDPRERNFGAEVADVKSILTSIRQGFPQARIVYKFGNHEDRFRRYMSVKAPELLGVADFELDRIYGLKDLDIEMVDSLNPMRLGKLNIVHGHEWKYGATNPVNPARGFFLRAKDHVLGSHLHSSSQHSERTIEGKVLSSWSTGCLCQLHPEYAPLNNWNHGFAFVQTDKSGIFHVENFKIIEGKVY